MPVLGVTSDTNQITLRSHLYEAKYIHGFKGKLSEPVVLPSLFSYAVEFAVRNDAMTCTVPE